MHEQTRLHDTFAAALDAPFSARVHEQFGAQRVPRLLRPAVRWVIRQFVGVFAHHLFSDWRRFATRGRRLIATAGGLTTQLAHEGELELWSGNPHGWTKIREVQVLSYREALVQEAAYERDTRPDRFRRALSVSSFADALIALHVGATDTAEAIMKRVAAESHDAETNYWRASTGALTFQARVYELLTGQPLAMDWSKLLPLEEYESLLSDDCTGNAYADALTWSCNAHIEQSAHNNKRLWPFAIGLSTSMPIEIMSWLRYRRGRGLEHATWGHPLLESPLANLDPPPSSPPASDLLRLLDRGMPHIRAYLEA